MTGDYSDDDRDGIIAVLEYFLGGDPERPSSQILPVASIETIQVEGIENPYLTIRFQREVAADSASYWIEFSADLVTWTAGGILVSQDHSGHNDGLVTELWRADLPRSSGDHYFTRLRVQY